MLLARLSHSDKVSFCDLSSAVLCLLSVRTCPRYIMRFPICTAVFSEVRVRLGLVQYGVMGLKWACGVNLVRLTL